MVEWQGYDELPCTKTLSEKSHTELLALKLKRIAWSEDEDGKIQRIKVLLNDNSTIDCGFSGMYFPKQFDFDPEIKQIFESCDYFDLLSFNDIKDVMRIICNQ